MSDTDRQKAVDFLLDRLAWYMSNMYQPFFEEQMRPVIEELLRLEPDAEVVREIARSAQEYLDAAVAYYGRTAELFHEGEDPEMMADEELQSLARRKREASAEWSELWQTYRGQTPGRIEVTFDTQEQLP